MFKCCNSLDSMFDTSKLSEEIPEVNWVPYGLRLRLTEDKKLEVWNIDDEVILWLFSILPLKYVFTCGIIDDMTSYSMVYPFSRMGINQIRTSFSMICWPLLHTLGIPERVEI